MKQMRQECQESENMGWKSHISKTEAYIWSVWVVVAAFIILHFSMYIEPRQERMHQFADEFVIPNTDPNYFSVSVTKPKYFSHFRFNKYDMVNHLVWIGCTYPSIEECAKSECLNRMLTNQTNVVDFCTRINHDCLTSDDCVIGSNCATGSQSAFFRLMDQPICKGEPYYDYEYADSIIIPLFHL
jgi:hypothetical protein